MIEIEEDGKMTIIVQVEIVCPLFEMVLSFSWISLGQYILLPAAIVFQHSWVTSFGFRASAHGNSSVPSETNYQTNKLNSTCTILEKAWVLHLLFNYIIIDGLFVYDHLHTNRYTICL